MTRIYATSAIVFIVALLGGIAAFIFTGGPGGGDRYADCRANQIAGSAKIGGPFELVSETGEIVTDKDVITGPTLIYFGYTFCPDVCPLDNARNAEAVTLLEDRGHVVKPVFITVDPARDTPQVMRDFTDLLHPRLLGLTGSEEQVDRAALAYKSYYKRHEPDADGYYLVDHMTYTYLVFPDDGFVDFIRREESPAAMADRVACFIEARS